MAEARKKKKNLLLRQAPYKKNRSAISNKPVPFSR
jgi:hypothetical protein